MSFEIRKPGFDKLQDLFLSYYDKTPGWMDHGSDGFLIPDALQRKSSPGDSRTSPWAFGTLFFITGAMFLLDWRLALIAMIVVPPLAAVSMYFQKRLLKSHREIRKQNSRITGGFNEGIMGAKTSKTMRREEKNLEEFTELTSGMYKASVRAAVLSALYLPAVSLLGAVGIALVLWRGGNMAVDSVIMIGTLYVFVSYVQRFFEPIRHISRLIAEMQSAQAAAERVMSLLAEEPKIVDAPEVVEKYGIKDGDGKEPWPVIRGDVSFEDVTFTYGGEEIILDRFSLEVKAGQVIALVGETGAGKSTIVNLICRFYEPTSGTIRIDGQDYTSSSDAMGCIPISGTCSSLRICSAAPLRTISATEPLMRQTGVEAAARLVSAHDFIIKTENSYKTEVGEGGNRLSTGEKQLISFARAILADPRIFCTGPKRLPRLTTETEQPGSAGHRGKCWKAGRAFVIAHRLSTVRSAESDPRRLRRAHS